VAVRRRDRLRHRARPGRTGDRDAEQPGRDRVPEDAKSETHDLLGRPLLDDVTDPETGEITPVIVMTDNGPCFKSRGRGEDLSVERTRTCRMPLYALEFLACRW
jgi:hypothetical protein